MDLSRKITILRKRRGWSQEQLSLKLEVSRQAVYKWEAGISQTPFCKTWQKPSGTASFTLDLHIVLCYTHYSA